MGGTQKGILAKRYQITWARPHGESGAVREQSLTLDCQLLALFPAQAACGLLQGLLGKGRPRCLCGWPLSLLGDPTEVPDEHYYRGGACT